MKEDELTICGFSAGGHLCGSVCVHYEDVKDENPKYSAISNRPDAAILSYPVITSGERRIAVLLNRCWGKTRRKNNCLICRWKNM